MASDSRRFTIGLLGSSVLLSALLGDTAHAAPPTEADFRITYYLTDELGDRVRQMSTFDMSSFINIARCECGQDLIARIGRTSTPVPDPVQIQAMVGQQCATAQAAPGVSPYDLCAQLVAGLPAVFQTGPEFHFDPIWLARGTIGEQAIESATPGGDCSSIYGQGGIWMCAGVTECMTGNFFMQGTSNINIPMDGTPAGISFDFVPPLTAPTNFRAQPGDSAVEIVWDASSIGDISGYRVLCADENGNPVEGAFDFDPPSAGQWMNGQLYYTRENLCPGGPFGEDYDPEGNGWDSASTSDTGTDDTTDTTETGTDTSDSSTDTDSGTDTECIEGSEGCPCIDGTTCEDGLACTNDICDPIACVPGEYGCLCDNGACDAGLECTANNFCMYPTTGLLSLDWRYICSPHISGVSKSARIEGLENGKTYQFLVVPYDYPGNPVGVDQLEVIEAAPVQTNGLWEQCEEQGNICGEPGFCAVVEPSRNDAAWLFGGLALIGFAGWGVRIRRRRVA